LSKKEPLKQLVNVEKTSEFVREISRISETETAIVEIEVDKDVVAAEAVVSTVEPPEIIPGRSHHHQGIPMVPTTFIVTDLRLERLTRTFRPGRAAGEGAEDVSALVQSLAAVLVQRHLAVHLLSDREGLHAATPQVNAVAVVL
jgi:hypothetical protein